MNIEFLPTGTILIVGLIFVLVIILAALLQGKVNSKVKYKKKITLITPAERSFMKVLESIIKDEHRVFVQVIIADILTPDTKDKKRWWKMFTKISSKHFDYVICNKSTFEVISVVELNDKSHNQPKRMERDKFIKAACDSANLNLITIKAKKYYNTEEIRAEVYVGENTILISDS